jgi:2'-5' RNA ligase
VTLFVGGFLAKEKTYDDDLPESSIALQTEMLKEARLPKFTLTVGALNSFKSAAFFEIHDPDNGLEKARSVLSTTTREIARGSYVPHVTVGLYAGAFPSKFVLERLSAFSMTNVEIEIHALTLATYRAKELGGLLSYRSSVSLGDG